MRVTVSWVGLGAPVLLAAALAALVTALATALTLTLGVLELWAPALLVAVALAALLGAAVPLPAGGLLPALVVPGAVPPRLGVAEGAVITETLALCPLLTTTLLLATGTSSVLLFALVQALLTSEATTHSPAPARPRWMA